MINQVLLFPHGSSCFHHVFVCFCHVLSAFVFSRKSWSTYVSKSSWMHGIPVYACVTSGHKKSRHIATNYWSWSAPSAASRAVSHAWKRAVQNLWGYTAVSVSEGVPEKDLLPRPFTVWQKFSLVKNLRWFSTQTPPFGTACLTLMKPFLGLFDRSSS